MGNNSAQKSKWISKHTISCWEEPCEGNWQYAVCLLVLLMVGLDTWLDAVPGTWAHTIWAEATGVTVNSDLVLTHHRYARKRASSKKLLKLKLGSWHVHTQNRPEPTDTLELSCADPWPIAHSPRHADNISCSLDLSSCKSTRVRIKTCCVCKH